MDSKINFTKAAIDGLPIPEHGKRATFHDIKVTGLQLRVTSSGIKSFCVFRRVNGGNPERITLGRFPDMTIEQARRKAAEINSLIMEGKNPAEVKRRRKAESTFAELFTEYLERHAKPRKKTWEEDVQKYNDYLHKAIGSKKLSMITREDIGHIHSAVTKSGRLIAANRVLALISSIYGWAISAGLWNNNPSIGIRRNKEHSRDRFIQSDELPRFFQALSEEPNTTIRDYILISLLTGARRSNVLSMHWQDINFERAEWRIEETKNGTPQTVALSPEVIEILTNRKLSSSAEFVFPGHGKSGHLQEPKKGWDRILDRAGIQNLRIHDLRRTLGSWQAKTGASLAIIGKSLNHKNQSTTAIYARLDLDPVRDSVNRATNAMLEAAGIKRSTEDPEIQK